MHPFCRGAHIVILSDKAGGGGVPTCSILAEGLRSLGCVMNYSD